MLSVKNWRFAFLAAAALFLLSWVQVRAGLYLGHKYIPQLDGYPKEGEIQDDLFRFDSVYYYGLAEYGYSYNGDPASSPNLVFAPLFPILTDALAHVPGLDAVSAGFLLNKLLLFGALVLLLQTLGQWLPRDRVILSLAALVTAGGSYALHAYYSESTMLFLISLVLFAHSRRLWLTLGLAAAALGASRLTALPVAGALACALLWQAWKSGPGRERWRLLAAAVLCPAGAAAYLGYIAVNFGNPFQLLPEIQQVSWGRFHPPNDWLMLLTGGYLFNYAWAAVQKGWTTFADIQTLNLVWTLLGLGAAVYLVRAWRWHVLTLVFLPYVLFIYYSNTSSEFLISAHRFFVLMVPIFIMASAAPRWAAALLLLVNIGYGLLHTAAFNQGMWFWF